LVIREEGDAGNRMEVGISAFAPDFLNDVPQQEMLGELVATVFSLRDQLRSTPGFTIVDEGEMNVERAPAAPEAYLFATVKDADSIRYYVQLSSKLISHFCISTATFGKTPTSVERLAGVLESAQVKDAP